MSEDSQAAPVRHWYRHRLVIFIATSIVISMILVVVAMELYASSGAAQLDLSRPGYISVQSKLDQSTSFESFPSDGTVDSSTMDQFQQLYDKQTKPVDNTGTFNTDALSNQSLGIDDTPASND